MHKIFINGRFLSQPITGVQRYAIELIREIDNSVELGFLTREKGKLIILTPKNIKHQMNLKNIEIKQVGAFTGHLWEQFELPIFAKGGLLINLCNTGPLAKLDKIVTIHDAAIFALPKSFSLTFQKWYSFLLKGLSRTSKKIITDSFFSKNELERYLKIEQENLFVNYLGIEHILSAKADNDILQDFELQARPFVLAVSSMNPSKNFVSVIRAIELLGEVNFNFVIAGGTNPKVFKNMREHWPKVVKYVGYVTDGQLKALYKNASCFIFPSLYEGFGLPPLEAMACGCPVIASNVASIPEVCGEAALYCNPNDPKDIADKVKLLLTDNKLRETLRNKGISRANEFTWGKCANRIITVIDEVLIRENCNCS